MSDPLDSVRFFGLLDGRRGQQRSAMVVLAVLVLCAVTWQRYGAAGSRGVLGGAGCAIVLLLGAADLVLARRRGRS